MYQIDIIIPKQYSYYREQSVEYFQSLHIQDIALKEIDLHDNSMQIINIYDPDDATKVIIYGHDKEPDAANIIAKHYLMPVIFLPLSDNSLSAMELMVTNMSFAHNAPVASVGINNYINAIKAAVNIIQFIRDE